MRSLRWIMPVILAVVVAWGCQTEKLSGPATTSQGAAKQWLQAAIAGDEQALRDVTVNSVEESVLRMAPRVRECVPQKAEFRWNTTFARKGDEAWSVMIRGTIISFELKRVGEYWEVLDVLTSD